MSSSLATQTVPVFDAVGLDDKYDRRHGRILISCRQALVRLPILQRERDAASGLNTAGLISGYRGSPLGGYDAELWKESARLKAAHVIFQPGLNEDLAATAIWGSQQIGAFPDKRFDGVFAIWYGKGPGVHRCGDPINHANMQGVAANGGVLLVFGDDHPGKSSTVAHQSDVVLAAFETPILYPSSVAEVIEYGLAGFALSRFSGLITGLKLVNETAEATGTVDLDALPGGFAVPDVPAVPGGVHARMEYAVKAQDRRMVQDKLPRAHAFARANRLDRMAFGKQQPARVIVTAGKAYLDVLSALGSLSIDAARAEEIGLGVFKVGMIYPLEPTALRDATLHASDVLFVEERRPQLEAQAPAILFDRGSRLSLAGKLDRFGSMLLPADGGLEVSQIAAAIAHWLAQSGVTVVESTKATVVPAGPAAASIARRPSFCAGCPHNTSTRVPDGSIGMTGIGCHVMAIFLPERKPMPPTHMGGEGAQWIGMAPFVGTSHVFQNLGDGTYSHSGSLAVRAAVIAGVNITFKILFNDAVAMTGGQPVEGALTVERIARQVFAEGVNAVAVVSDNPDRFRRDELLPTGVTLDHRDALDEVQKRLRATRGTTILIYDQVCAAEKRRRRKRNSLPKPSAAVFINPLVCEGCGDCSVQSNCIAIRPLDTDLGVKRQIDQSSCNVDMSCLKGFCPSFVTLTGARPRKMQSAPPGLQIPELPEPVLPRAGDCFNILVTGIGGTGVVTIGAILGMAAHLEGKALSSYDMTGLSQKAGAVFSHLRITRPGVEVPARIGAAEADVILACDSLAATSADAVTTAEQGRTIIVVNTDVEATADFQRNAASRPDSTMLLEQLRRLTRGPLHAIPASGAAMMLLGDTIAANMMMVGRAWQEGLIPLSRAGIEQAIRLNGVAIDMNLRAFALGRWTAVDPIRFEALLSQKLAPAGTEKNLDRFIQARIADLVAYQNRRYATRYADLLSRVKLAEKACSEGDALSWAVARAGFKLMAYKDEYEVARLYADGRFETLVHQQFQSITSRNFYLSPPLLAKPDRRTGRPRKFRLPSVAMLGFKLLMRMKGLRGGRLDPFGYAHERRLERQLRDEYLEIVDAMLPQLSRESVVAATAVASAPLAIRGYGPVKMAAIEGYVVELGRLLKRVEEARKNTGALASSTLNSPPSSPGN